MATEPKRYHVFVGGKTSHSKPRLLDRVEGKKNAEKMARDWRAEHPGRYVGIFEMKKVKVFKPSKKTRR